MASHDTTTSGGAPADGAGRFLYLRMAYRNVMRNRRRTLVTVFAVAFTFVMILFFVGMMNGMFDMVLYNTVSLRVGDLQAHEPGYLEDQSLWAFMGDKDELVAATTSDGIAVSPRSYGFGLVAKGDESVGARLWAVDPALENKVTKLHEHLVTGTFIDGKGNGVVIGSKVAVNLKAKVGDELLAVVQAADGSIGNAMLTVKGILGPVDETVDRTAAIVGFPMFDSLFASDTKIHELAFSVGDGVTMDDAKATLAKALPGKELKAWDEIDPLYKEMYAAMDAGKMVMIIIFYGAVALVLLNTMLMAVMERIRQFGVMKAVGMRPMAVFRLILEEASVIVGLGLVVGVIVGIPLVYFFGSHGIDFSFMMSGEMSVMGKNFGKVLYGKYNAEAFVLPVVSMFVLTWLGVLYPAIKAARLLPVKALTHH